MAQEKKTRAKGRPSKLTPTTQRRLLDALSAGATYDLACKYAGISFQTFINWRERAEAGGKANQPYVELFDELQKAEGEAAVKWLLKIERAASNGNWQAAAWKLERRYKEQYGRLIHELQGSTARPVQIQWVDAIDPTDEVGLGADELPSGADE
jgi:transposase